MNINPQPYCASLTFNYLNKIELSSKDQFNDFVKSLAQYLPFKLSTSRELIARAMDFNSSNGLLSKIASGKMPPLKADKIIDDIKAYALKEKGVVLEDKDFRGWRNSGTYRFRSDLDLIYSCETVYLMRLDALEVWKEAHRIGDTKLAEKLLINEFDAWKIKTSVNYVMHLVNIDTTEIEEFKELASKLSYYDRTQLIAFVLRSKNWKKFLSYVICNNEAFEMSYPFLLCEILSAKPDLQQKLVELKNLGFDLGSVKNSKLYELLAEDSSFNIEQSTDIDLLTLAEYTLKVVRQLDGLEPITSKSISDYTSFESLVLFKGGVEINHYRSESGNAAHIEVLESLIAFLKA